MTLNAILGIIMMIGFGIGVFGLWMLNTYPSGAAVVMFGMMLMIPSGLAFYFRSKGIISH